MSRVEPQDGGTPKIRGLGQDGKTSCTPQFTYVPPSGKAWGKGYHTYSSRPKLWACKIPHNSFFFYFFETQQKTQLIKPLGKPNSSSVAEGQQGFHLHSNGFENPEPLLRSQGPREGAIQLSHHPQGDPSQF
jgi:hypothetical protein